MSAMQYKWESRARTDKGNVRKHNEDAFLELSERGVWVVADGMGGHRSGDMASQLVVDLVENIDETDRPGKLLDIVEDALIAANRDLFAKSLDGDVTTVVGSTVAALIVIGEYTITAWAGDSRVYRLREGVLEQISRDHSEVEELIEQGVLTRASAEDHPAANVITRAVGGAERLFLDMELLALRDRDRYLLCSDGLYKELTEQEIAFHLGNGSCAQACERLMEIALARECSDNVTALVVDFRARAA